MALIPGVYQNKNHLTIGTQSDVCIVCTEGKDRFEAMETVGHLNGKIIFKGESVHGEQVCICGDCLLKLAKEYEAIERQK